VFTRGGKILVALALAFSLGAHWSLLQVIAWVNMTVTYAQDATLTEAIGKTFDGKHACQLCKLVDEGKQTEQQQSTTVQKHKLELISSEATIWVLPAETSATEFAAVSLWRSHSEPPTPPPPRAT
jgi:hypothetical protein